MTNKTLSALKTLWDAIPENARGEAEDDAHAILREFIHDMLDEQPKQLDQDALTQFIFDAQWEWREDYGHFVAYHSVNGPVADILNWTCVSCRDDVGWADWTSLRADPTTGEIWFEVECGHCGWDSSWDEFGNELDD